MSAEARTEGHGVSTNGSHAPRNIPPFDVIARELLGKPVQTIDQKAQPYLALAVVIALSVLSVASVAFGLGIGCYALWSAVIG